MHHEHRCSPVAGPPTLEPFDFLARSALHAQLSQADIRRLPLKYLLRHLLNRFSEKLTSYPNQLRLDPLIALLALADEVID